MAKKQVNNVVNSVGIIKLGGIYTVGLGYHFGKKIRIDDIAEECTIALGNTGVMWRRVHGKILNSDTRINTVLETLQEFKDDQVEKSGNYKSLNTYDLIRMVKSGNKNSIVEFVKRYKKMPKYKKNGNL